jgi:HSP20 family protein
MFYNRLTREYPVRSQYNRPNFRPFNRFNQMTEERYMNEWQWNQLHTATPVTDILELDDQFVLEIALPGVVLDDVELKVEENILTVIAKRTPNMFEERAHLLHKELPCGFFVRHFEFETPIIIEHIEARMDRGILFVSLPKVEQAIRIPVSHGSIEGHLPGMKTRVTPKSEQLSSRKELTVK